MMLQQRTCNLRYNCPTSVMTIGGNDHIVEFNDVHSAVQESGCTSIPCARAGRWKRARRS